MTTYGFAPIRTAWLAQAANLGKSVRAQVGGKAVYGTFTTINKQGALVLETTDGVLEISAGDVHFNEESQDAAGH